jgi:hypothetical protein
MPGRIGSWRGYSFVSWAKAETAVRMVAASAAMMWSLFFFIAVVCVVLPKYNDYSAVFFLFSVYFVNFVS